MSTNRISATSRLGLAVGRALTPLLTVPKLLLVDSVISRLGYWYASAVGFAWGFFWSVGRVERRGGLWVFRGMPRRTFGRGGSCVGGSYLTADNVTDDVLEHEAVHKRQWQRYGMLFPVLYFVAGRDPLHNRFEIEAGLEKGGYL
jgi:hypothetical protein